MPDDYERYGIAVGEYTYGSGSYTEAPEGYDGGPAVLFRARPERNDKGQPVPLWSQYRVVLPVGDIWKAQAIAAILNAK